MKVYILKFILFVVISHFLFGCGGPTDPVIVEAIKNEMIKEKKTIYSLSDDLSILLQRGAIYGSSGGIDLDEKVEKIRVMSSAKFKESFVDWLIKGNYVTVSGDRSSSQFQGNLTQKGEDYLETSNFVVESRTGSRFCFFEQEINVIEKKKFDDDSYIVKYTINYVPIKAPHVTGTDISMVDFSKLKEAVYLVKVVKRNGIWNIKRFF